MPLSWERPSYKDICWCKADISITICRSHLQKKITPTPTFCWNWTGPNTMDYVFANPCCRVHHVWASVARLHGYLQLCVAIFWYSSCQRKVFSLALQKLTQIELQISNGMGQASITDHLSRAECVVCRRCAWIRWICPVEEFSRGVPSLHIYWVRRFRSEFHSPKWQAAWSLSVGSRMRTRWAIEVCDGKVPLMTLIVSPAANIILTGGYLPRISSHLEVMWVPGTANCHMHPGSESIDDSKKIWWSSVDSELSRIGFWCRLAVRFSYALSPPLLTLPGCSSAHVRNWPVGERITPIKRMPPSLMRCCAWELQQTFAWLIWLWCGLHNGSKRHSSSLWGRAGTRKCLSLTQALQMLFQTDEPPEVYISPTLGEQPREIRESPLPSW